MRQVRRMFAGSLILTLAPIIASWIVPLPARLAVGPSVVIRYQDRTPAHVFLAPDDRWRIRVTLQDIDPDYLAALIAYEDKRFWHHPGFDPIALTRALAQNIATGEIVSGASTLSMQLVRMVEPRPRTIRSKLIEMIRAAQLEVRLGKEGVLEGYLEHAPFGRNIEGVEAASLMIFGHQANRLAPDEIAVLVAIPQSPNRRYPHPSHYDELTAARDSVVTRLVQEEIFSFEDFGVGRKGQLPEVPNALTSMPREAPHASVWLHERNVGVVDITTTLDKSIQSAAQERLARQQNESNRRGIHDVAMVVIEHQSGALRALVGNFDFSQDRLGAQIAAFNAPRSTGSALKPFIYANAIDQGLVLPEFLVQDIPARYGSYAPANYDGQFDGLVQLDDALARSLNMPFVDLLQQVGMSRFVGTIRSAGAQSLHPDDNHYGLSAAIGGMELTPLELTTIYTALARDGTVKHPHLLEEVPSPDKPFAIMSPEAAWLTKKALTRRDRPDFPDRARFARVPTNIHWKTGTSYGHHDAWAIGSNERYTVGVWLGNLDRAPSSYLVGAQAAGPILFNQLESLAVPLTERRPAAAEQPAGLVPVPVCAYSGRPAKPNCPETKEALAIASNVPTEKCSFHQTIEVDQETGLAVVPGCRAGRQTNRRVVTVLPAIVRRYLESRHGRIPTPPPLHPDCSGGLSTGDPVILHPPPHQVALLLKGIPASEQEIPLTADGPSGARLSWFINGAFLGTVDAAQPLWWQPSPGTHHLVVTDEAGRLATRALEVRYR